MISEDREILRHVWEGRVAACITLAETDTMLIAKPDPHYLMLPRMSYMMLIIDRVRNIHFIS